MNEGMRLWPENQPLTETDLLRVACNSCEQVWGIHKDMAGFRLACACGQWIQVPWQPQATGMVPSDVALPSPSKKTPLLLADRGEEDPEGLVKLTEMAVGEVRMERVPTDLALAAGELRHASVESQARWTNRAILELVGILLAFWLPMILVSVTRPASEWVQLMPFASLVSSVLVVSVGYFASTYAFSGLRMPNDMSFVEAAFAAIVASFAAYLYVQVLHSAYPEIDSSMATFVDTLGIPLAIAVLALCPAVFEELAFRGLLQGRLSAVMGRTQGILITGCAFALAHGLTFAFPIHLGLGVYLCWLRARSGSLLPGMLFHALYNTAVIIAIE